PKFKAVSVYYVLESIKTGKNKPQVSAIRVETDKTKRNKLKSKLEYVTFYVTLTTRANSNINQHSGLDCLDLDDVPDLTYLRIDVNNDSYTFASFVSPSGNGLKVLVRIPLVDNNDDYQDYYIKLTEYYSQYAKLDEGTKDIARATYLSYDDHLF